MRSARLSARVCVSGARRKRALGPRMRASPAGSQDTPTNRYMFIWHTIVRMFFPIWFAYLLIMFAFRIGVKRRDKCARPVRRLGLGLPNPLHTAWLRPAGAAAWRGPAGVRPGGRAAARALTGARRAPQDLRRRDPGADRPREDAHDIQGHRGHRPGACCARPLTGRRGGRPPLRAWRSRPRAAVMRARVG